MKYKFWILYDDLNNCVEVYKSHSSAYEALKNQVVIGNGHFVQGFSFLTPKQAQQLHYNEAIAVESIFRSNYNEKQH